MDEESKDADSKADEGSAEKGLRLSLDGLESAAPVLDKGAKAIDKLYKSMGFPHFLKFSVFALFWFLCWRHGGVWVARQLEIGGLRVDWLSVNFWFFVAVLGATDWIIFRSTRR